MCHNDVATEDDQQQLQEDLNKLAAWEEKWKMSFHPEKCNTVHMTRRRTTLEYPYTLHGHQLHSVDQAKYLGVTISANLKWEAHISASVSKANKTLGFLRRNLNTRNRRVKERAYKALVRPLLKYASPIWDPTTNTSIDSIEKVQRCAAQWVSQDFRQSTRSEDLIAKLDWPLLQTRRFTSTTYALQVPPQPPLHQHKVPTHQLYPEEEPTPDELPCLRHPLPPYTIPSIHLLPQNNPGVERPPRGGCHSGNA
jgi:hypothetical protein